MLCHHGNKSPYQSSFEHSCDAPPVQVVINHVFPSVSPSGISTCSSLTTTTYRSTTGSLTPRLTLCRSSGRTKQTDPTKWSSAPPCADTQNKCENLWTCIPEPPAVCLKTKQKPGWLQMPRDRISLLFLMGSKRNSGLLVLNSCCRVQFLFCFLLLFRSALVESRRCHIT